MNDTDPALTLTEASAAIERGELSPVALMSGLADRIERLEPRIRAFAHLRLDAAMAEARTAESDIAAGNCKGPLHGLPMVLKDIYETAGVPTTYGSRVFAGHLPQRDCNAWRRLREAGAILLGKADTHEFANGGPTRASDRPYDLRAVNAWNPQRYTGGSSSGSASAVSASLCPAALGSDTGGSIRIPASYCGLTGFKPTYGLIGRSGVFPVSHSLDHCGTITWTAVDAALLLSVLAGPDPDDPTGIDAPAADYVQALTETLAGRRIGFVRHWSHEDIAANDEVNGALDGAVTTLCDLGARVEEVRLPPLADYTACNSIIAQAESYTVHETQLREHYDTYSEYTRDRLTLAACIRAADYLQAQRLRRDLARETAQAMKDLDALVCLMTPTTAPDAEFAADRYQKFFFLRVPVPATVATCLGLPSASVCSGFAGDGMPLSMQIIGRPRGDGEVLAIADAYQRAVPWSRQRPDL